LSFRRKPESSDFKFLKEKTRDDQLRCSLSQSGLTGCPVDSRWNDDAAPYNAQTALLAKLCG